MENKKIILNETTFTSVCKTGFLVINSSSGRDELSFTKNDIRKLRDGCIVDKILNDSYEVTLVGLDNEMIIEIVKRSPIYSELSNEF